MSFRLGNLNPRATARHERDVFAWSLLAAVVLTGLLAYRFSPLYAVCGGEYLCSYPLMLTGTFVLLRRQLGRQDAAMVGGLAFAFSSFNLLHFVHPHAVAAVAHLPWLLLMIDIIMVEARPWKVVLAQSLLVLLTASQVLLGCPQYVWFSLLTETGFTILLIGTRWYLPRDGCEAMPTCGVCVGCRRNSSFRVILAKGIGFLGAVQLLPALETLSKSRPSADLPEGATLHPINLIQLVAPYLPVDRAFGGNARELGLYVGAVPLVLALWVLAHRNRLGGMKRLAQATAAFAAAALLLALGSQGRFVSLEHASPWVVWFHFSCRYLVLFQFSVAVLAAIGFVLVEREAREKENLRRYPPERAMRSRAAALWRQFEILGATVLISLAVAAVGLILQSRQQVASVPRVLVGPLLIIFAAALVIAAARGVRGALVGLVLFMAADLGCYGLTAIEPPAPQPQVRLAPPVAPNRNPTENLAKIGGNRPGRWGPASK